MIISVIKNIWSHLMPATKSDLKKLADKIMSQFTDLAAAVRTAHDTLQTDIAGVKTDAAALAQQIADLNTKVAALTPSAADAAAVTQIQSDMADLVSSGNDLKTSTDALLVPTIPGVPPPTPPATPAP